MKNKVVSLFLVLCMISGTLIFIPMIATATSTYTSEGLSYYINDNQVTITGLDNSISDLIIPFEIDGYPVVNIGDWAFESAYCLSSVILPYTIKNIGCGAFYGCYNLRSIEIPNGVTYIGDYAFAESSFYDSYYHSYHLVLPDSITYIGEGAFASTDINSIVLPSGLATIASETFDMCTHLEEIIIPSSVTSIEDRAFNGCSNLQNVYFEGTKDELDSVNIEDETLKNLTINCKSYISKPVNGLCGTNATWEINEQGVLIISGKGTMNDWLGKNYAPWYPYRDNIYDVVISDEITTVGACAFYECQNIKSVSIGKNVIKIQEWAFYGCTNIKKVNIPPSVTYMGDYAFGGCWSLHKIDIESILDWCSIEFEGDSSNPLCSGGALYVNNNLLTDIAIPSELKEIKKYTFCNNSEILSIVIPENISSICDGAFKGCMNLNSIKFENGLTNIGNSAFAGCVYISSINIHSGISNIGDWAFSSCDSLSNVVLNEGLETIGAYAFSWCDKITSISIPDSVLHIGASAFYNCGNMEITSFSKNLITIGDGAFHGCKKIKSMNIPNSVTYLGADVFMGCSSIEKISLPSNIKEIGKGTFCGCTGLTAIKIPDGVTSIGDSAFDGCTGLTAIKIPNGVTSIGFRAFKGCNNIEEMTLPFIGNKKDESENSHFGYIFGAYSYYKNSEYVPASVKTLIITSSEKIFDYAFNECSNISSISIPETINYIGANVFSKCDISDIFITDLSAWCNISTASRVESVGHYWNLHINNEVVTKLTIPDSVEKINSYTFRNCNVTEIDIGDGVKEIEDEAFYYHSIEIIHIGENLKRIGRHAFRACNNLKIVDISDLSIWCKIDFEEDASDQHDDHSSNPMYYADKLYINGEFPVHVTISDDVTKIPAYTFKNQEKLESVVFSNSVTTIGEMAFSNCTALKTVFISESIENIESLAFLDCDALEGVYISDMSSWCKINFNNYYSSNPLYYAKKLYLNGDIVTDIKIPEEITYLNSCVFCNCSELKNVTMLNSVTGIGNGAFFGCSDLKNITMSNSIRVIGDSAFENCKSLEKIEIPSSVYTIGYCAFSGCRELQGVYITDLKAWCNIWFVSNYSNPAIYTKNIYLNDKPITELVIPDGIKRINAFSFYYCKYITSVKIPYGVTSIWKYSFEGCSALKEIVIPNSVTSIEEHVFYDCKNLTDVYYTGTESEWNEINIGSGNTYLTGATIHYNYKPETDDDEEDDNKPLPNVTRTITADFTGGQDIIYNTDNNSYNTDSFLLSGTIENLMMWEDSKREDFNAHNVKVEITLPNSFSFDKDTATKTKTYTYDEIAYLAYILDTIYLNNPSVGKSQASIKITGDNINEQVITYDFNVDKSEFQIDTYRANYLINSDTGSKMEEEYLNFDTPSKTIVDTGKSNGLSTMIDAWKLVTGGADVVDDPTKIVDFACDQKDVYEAIIMDLLETSVDIRIMECINNDITKETKKYTDLIISDMKNLYKYENLSAYKDICSMDDDFIKLLKDTVTEDFKFEHKDANAISKVSSFIGQTIEYATDLEQYCEKLIAFCDMLQLSDSMKTIVLEMYNECPPENVALKSALLECTMVINSGEDEFTAMMVAEFFGVAGLNVGEFFFDKLWDKVKTKFMIMNPSAFAVLAAYKTGKYVTNVAFNTDTIAEKYYKLAAVNEVEDLLKVVYRKIKGGYQAGGTIQQAKNYNSMVDFMFNMLNADCEYSVTYLNETDDTLVSEIKHIFGNNDIYDAIAYVEDLKQEYEYFHEKVTTDWIIDAAGEYPSIFAQYSSVLSDSIKKQKEYFINCPVDVYVYDKNGVIVGTVVNNIPYCRSDANLTIGVEGDKKTIYMYGDEYNIVYIGNDTGTMDISVIEYDETNSQTRNVYFNNIELTDGLTYTSSEVGTNSTENAYVLSNEADENITPDYDTLSNLEDAYTAKMTRGYFTNTMAVSQELHTGENTEIAAYIPEGYEFAGWTSDSEDDIFDDVNSVMTKITMPDYDVNITAKLVAVPTLSISSITDSSVTFKSINCDEITSGTLILAIYNDNGALEQLISEDFAKEITFDNLKLTSGTAKVMLWDSLNNLNPLTNAVEKMFYFETAEIE